MLARSFWLRPFGATHSEGWRRLEAPAVACFTAPNNKAREQATTMGLWELQEADASPCKHHVQSWLQELLAPASPGSPPKFNWMQVSLNKHIPDGSACSLSKLLCEGACAGMQRLHAGCGCIAPCQDLP